MRSTAQPLPDVPATPALADERARLPRAGADAPTTDGERWLFARRVLSGADLRPGETYEQRDARLDGLAAHLAKHLASRVSLPGVEPDDALASELAATATFIAAHHIVCAVHLDRLQRAVNKLQSPGVEPEGATLTGPMVAPHGGFTLVDVARAYIAGATDARAYSNKFHSGAPDALLDSCADAYVKSVAVPLDVSSPAAEPGDAAPAETLAIPALTGCCKACGRAPEIIQSAVNGLPLVGVTPLCDCGSDPAQFIRGVHLWPITEPAPVGTPGAPKP